MTICYDILGLGCAAIDDLLYLAQYPAPDTKMAVRRRDRQCGGLTCTALVAAARLGSRCAFAGVLGDDELSRFVAERYRQEGVDTSLMRCRPGARPVHSIIIVDESTKTRTILFDSQGAFGAEPDWPEPVVIEGSKVLFVDHFGVEGMIRAAGIARAAGVPVVADLENDQHPRFPDLLGLVDHLIVSKDFATRLTGQTDPATAAQMLWSADRHAVVVTCGGEGGWYVGPDHPRQPRYYPAFAVEVVDTTGCGDVFHGAYASALARGLDLEPRIRFAAAAAALKATQPGGQSGIPTRAEVERFLEKATRADFL